MEAVWGVRNRCAAEAAAPPSLSVEGGLAAHFANSGTTAMTWISVKVVPHAPGRVSSISTSARRSARELAPTIASRRGRSDAANCNGSRKYGCSLVNATVWAKIVGRKPIPSSRCRQAAPRIEVPAACAEPLHDETKELLNGRRVRIDSPRGDIGILENDPSVRSCKLAIDSKLFFSAPERRNLKP